MKLFQQLLVAPAALGLLAPLAANAAELNINEVSNYSATSEAVQGISQFSDVYPTDWAYQALTNLAERHGCVVSTSGGSMTRYEAAALLNTCLGNVSEVNDEERRLLNEFSSELAVVRGRVNDLEASITGLEAGMFSTTTKLSGRTVFVTGAVDDAAEGQALSFNYDTKIWLDSSFNGTDLLSTRITAGNFSDNSAFDAGESAPLEGVSATSNNLTIDRAFYQFPVGDELTVTVGAKVRQDDLLAVWPSSYPGDSVLDVLTSAGANGAYNLSEGAGAGVSYAFNDAFTASLAYIGEEAETSNAGILTKESGDDITAQLGYVTEGFTAALVFTTSEDGTTSETADYDAWGISADWTPENAGGAIPTISGGLGWKTLDAETTTVKDEFTWTVGLQWSDAFVAGNTLGFGIGSAEGWQDKSGYDDPLAYEVWYEMAISDNVSVTPAVFVVEKDGSTEDVTGALVKTTFRF